MDELFSHCRCPHSKVSLHEVSVTARTCPSCNHPLDSYDVWMTRRRPGEIVLPGWVRVLGWPLLCTLTGGTVIALQFAGIGSIPRRGLIMSLASGLFAIGLASLIRILAMGGDD